MARTKARCGSTSTALRNKCQGGTSGIHSTEYWARRKYSETFHHLCSLFSCRRISTLGMTRTHRPTSSDCISCATTIKKLVLGKTCPSMYICPPSRIQSHGTTRICSEVWRLCAKSVAHAQVRLLPWRIRDPTTEHLQHPLELRYGHI